MSTTTPSSITITVTGPTPSSFTRTVTEPLRTRRLPSEAIPAEPVRTVPIPAQPVVPGPAHLHQHEDHDRGRHLVLIAPGTDDSPPRPPGDEPALQPHGPVAA